MIVIPLNSYKDLFINVLFFKIGFDKILVFPNANVAYNTVIKIR